MWRHTGTVVGRGCLRRPLSCILKEPTEKRKTNSAPGDTLERKRYVSVFSGAHHTVTFSGGLQDGSLALKEDSRHDMIDTRDHSAADAANAVHVTVSPIEGRVAPRVSVVQRASPHASRGDEHHPMDWGGIPCLFFLGGQIFLVLSFFFEN